MENFLDIDPDKLDEEWVGQPRLYHKYAKKLAQARKDHATAKATLDVTEAECAWSIKKNPANFGISGRVTDAAVKNAIFLHSKYQIAVQMVNEAKHTVDLYEAATKALEHRKAALQDLVFLWGQSYFAGTMKTRKGTDEGVRDRVQQSSLKATVTRERKR